MWTPLGTYNPSLIMIFKKLRVRCMKNWVSITWVNYTYSLRTAETTGTVFFNLCTTTKNSKKYLFIIMFYLKKNSYSYFKKFNKYFHYYIKHWYYLFFHKLYIAYVPCCMHTTRDTLGFIPRDRGWEILNYVYSPNKIVILIIGV
jgi:hypothetical protein